MGSNQGGVELLWLNRALARILWRIIVLTAWLWGGHFTSFGPPWLGPFTTAVPADWEAFLGSNGPGFTSFPVEVWLLFQEALMNSFLQTLAGGGLRLHQNIGSGDLCIAMPSLVPLVLLSLSPEDLDSKSLTGLRRGGHGILCVTTL